MPFSVAEPYAKRREVAIHRLAPADARVENVFITRRDLIRPPALDEFIRTFSEKLNRVACLPAAAGPLPLEWLAARPHGGCRKAPSTGNWTVDKAVLTMERYACVRNLRGF